MKKSLWIRVVALVLLSGLAIAKGWDVTEAGAVGDGNTDCTAIFQRVLDTAAAAGGGIVQVPAGKYKIAGSLVIPEAVTLEGVFRVPPTDQGGNPLKINGSVLLAYANRGKAEAEPFIKLGGCNASVSGLAILYPEWKQTDVPPVPYPPTIAAQGVNDVAVTDCLIVQPYEAIHFDLTARFVVRNVFGSPIFRGLFVDQCYDIGRVENCHFWPFGVAYDPKNPFCEWVNTQGTAFEFARTDWQYVTNTFCFGYGAGYKFSAYKSGGCNGNFLGIGADSCRRAVLVEQMQPFGLLITNGEFVGRWSSEDSVTIEIAEGAGDGKVSLNNCAFWGPIDRCIWQRSADAQLTALGCNFYSWDNTAKSSPAIQLDRGKAILQGNTFGQGQIQLKAGAAVRSAIVMGNQAADGFSVDNAAGARVQLLANETVENRLSGEGLRHYRVLIGANGDQAFLRDWNGKEDGPEWNQGRGKKRWSGTKSLLLLPVKPRTKYTASLDVYVPKEACADGNAIYLGDEKLADLPTTSGTAVVTFKVPATRQRLVTLQVRAKGWKPGDTIPGSIDGRTLGIAARSVTMKAAHAPEKPVDVN